MKRLFVILRIHSAFGATFFQHLKSFDVVARRMRSSRDRSLIAGARATAFCFEFFVFFSEAAFWGYGSVTTDSTCAAN